MAGGRIGNLSVGLGLDYAEYTAGLTKAQAQAQRFADGFKASFAGNLAADFTKDLVKQLSEIPGRFVDMVKGAIDAADHLNDLSQKTGIAAVTLGGIGFAAKQAGSDLDSAAAGIGKLNKSIAEAAAGNKEAAEAFAAVGVAVKNASGQSKAADAVLAELADKFASYADGPEKVALALRLFGKAGADMIPLLNEGGASLIRNAGYFERYSGVTKETVKAADQFNDTLAKLQLLSGAFATTLASQLLPGLQAVADEFLRSKEEAGAFNTIIGAIRVTFETVAVLGSDLAFVLTQVAKGIGAVAESAVALARLDFSGAKTIFEVYNKQAADARRNLDEFQAKVLGFNPNFSNEGRSSVAPPAPPKPPAPRLPGSGAAAAAAEEEARLRKVLDGTLRDIRNATDAQQSALAFANRFLDGEYQDGLVSLENFYDDQSNIRQRALQVLLREQDRIIAAEKAFRDATKNPASKVDATNRIADAEQTKKRVTVDKQQNDAIANQQRARAANDLAKAFEGVNAQVLDLNENFAAAAAIKFDLQFDALSKTFSANGNEAGKQAIATLRAAAIAQAKFNEAALATSRTQQDLANLEERVAIALQTGALTSIEALAKIGDARRQQIAILERQVAAEEALAAIEKAKGTAGADDLIRKAEAARLSLDKLKASADPLAESLNKAFGDDFNNALDDFILKTESLSDAIKSLGKAWLATVLKMGTKSITESISGGSGGIGGAISDIFKNIGGGSSSEAGAAPTAGALEAIQSLFKDSGAIAAKAAETASVSSATLAVTALTTATTAATAALTSLAASSTASSVGDVTSSAGDFASFFDDFAGFFAGGGDIGPGKWGVVGENGPELAFGGNAGKTIQPAGQPGRVYNINVPVQAMQGVSRESAEQQGAAVGAAIQRAMLRNN